MATSFKVPSSPAKSIFEIDEFLGVDLTNSGTNINEHRSPNAPNMIRHVPGKVRKRTGYQTDTVFGNGLNTNLAIGASENVDEFELDTNASGNYTILYNLFIQLHVSEEDKQVYLEFDYQADETFWVTGIGWLQASPDDFTHYEGWVTISKSVGLAYIRAISNSQNQQTIKIKRFLATYQKDNNYRWQKAPNHFVYADSNEPIYGVHSLKTTEPEGNRVVNVNRALNTGDIAQTVSVTNSWSQLYRLADYQSPKRKVTVDFDYTLSGEPIWLFVGGRSTKLEITDEEIHVSREITNNDAYNNLTNVQIMTASGTSASLSIRNFSVVYEKDEQYAWSPAPEDNGETFDLRNIYFVNEANSGLSEEVSKWIDVVSTTTPSLSADICDDTHNGSPMCHIDMYVTTTSQINATSVKLEILSNKSISLFTKTYAGNLASEHIDEYLFTGDADAYAKTVKVTYTLERQTTYETTVDVDIVKIKVNKLTPRERYNISAKQYIYHVGKKFFLRMSGDDTFTEVYADANRQISSAWQIGEDLIIADGKDLYSYKIGEENVLPVVNREPYIPTVTISKYPQGGGTSYEAINMLTPAFYETFVVTENEQTETAFHLSFTELDSTKVVAWVLQGDGSWRRIEEGNGISVIRNTGIVFFSTAPGVSPLTGEDNVKILAYKTFPGYKDRISKCTIGTLFGVNGASDRLFLSGNPDYPNWDFYSEMNDATYFPDTGYSSLGLSSSAIVGYARVNNYLATFKDEYEPSQSVFIREGDLVTDPDTKVSNPAFKLINTLQGNGVIASHSFGYLQTEPLFLTRSGVYAITAQDITGEKYSQNRSFFLNGQLTKEIGLEDAYAVVHNDMYILSVNGKLYILDGLQPIQTDRSAPYSTRQYVGFYCTDVPALTMWTDDKALWFGTPDGKVCSFATDIEALESYSDNGEPIYCCWETPDLDGKLFYKNKSFRYIAIRMMAALKTSVSLWSMARGAWSFIKEDNNTGIFFDFENIDFEAFSFSTDRSDKVAHSKIRVKKVDKARFKIENGKLNEPFGLMNLALEYVESGNYKG